MIFLGLGLVWVASVWLGVGLVTLLCFPLALLPAVPSDLLRAAHFS